jgi:hypothetical protein
MDEDAKEDVVRRTIGGQKKKSHLVLVLKRLFQYMFQEKSVATSKKITQTQKTQKRTKKKLQNVLNN